MSHPHKVNPACWHHRAHWQQASLEGHVGVEENRLLSVTRNPNSPDADSFAGVHYAFVTGLLKPLR